jgi:hypothetical protein
MIPHHSHRHGRHTFEWGDPERAILELDYIRSDRGDVSAEVSATSTAPAHGGLVHVARVNLLSTRSLAEYSAHVAKRTNGVGTDWPGLVAAAAVETVRVIRAGTPAVLLADVEPAPDAGYILREPDLPARLPAALFGDGGSAKSLLALAVAASIVTGEPYLGRRPTTTGPVGYLDWEMDGPEHRDRLLRLAGEPLPGVLYVPCSRPLADDVDRLRRIVDRHELVYLIVDSVALACDGPPEAAEVAVRFFGALRELGLGSLLVAHVNRAGDTDRPFGSAFWHNGARSTWYAKLEAELGGAMTVGLFHKKANIGPRSAPLGFRVEWGDRITLERTDLRDIPDLATHIPLAYRLADALRTGARTVAALAAETGADVETVRRTLNRRKDRFRSMTGPDGVTRWGLLAGREATS